MKLSSQTIHTLKNEFGNLCNINVARSINIIFFSSLNVPVTCFHLLVDILVSRVDTRNVETLKHISSVSKPY